MYEDYAKYIAERLDENTDWQDYLLENISNGNDYVTYIAESLINPSERLMMDRNKKLKKIINKI